MNQVASNYYTRSTNRPGGRGEVLALGIALVVSAGSLAAAVAPAGDPAPNAEHHAHVRNVAPGHATVR